MAKRVGTVVVFKSGTTKAQAEAALKKLAEVVEYTPRVNDFDDEWGGPVWYIP